MVLYALYVFIVIIFSPDIAVCGPGMDIVLLLTVFYFHLILRYVDLARTLCCC